MGLGLIGGSIALALRLLGYTVGGSDSDPEREHDALARQVIDGIGLFNDAEITFVATPVGTIVETAKQALESTNGLVTDVGSVKTHVCSAVDDPRFVGGHPMAGSELDGLDGADASMFEGAVWVLCPSATTADESFARVVALVSRFGAEVTALPARRHDELVAIVSHVPHLMAATLMGLADERSEEHLALLRLAAGGFRDMTRIASGRPGIWLDICEQNRDAIVDGLDAMTERLLHMRDVVLSHDRQELKVRLERARAARMNLPSRVVDTSDLVEVRVPIPDRPGAAAEVFSLSADLGVNVSDFEVVHSVEGDRGVMVLVVRAAQSQIFRGGLLARGFRPSVVPLS